MELAAGVGFPHVGAFRIVLFAAGTLGAVLCFLKGHNCHVLQDISGRLGWH